MKKKIFRKSAAVVMISLVSFFTIGLFFSSSAYAKTLKLISGFPQTHLFTQGCVGTFEKNLEQVSGGQLTLEIHGPDVILTNEQFEPLRSGVFDLLFTHPAYHLGTTAIGSALEGINPDPVKRRETGIIDFVDQEYQKFGVKMLAVLPMAKYNIVLKAPIGANSPSLNGLKLRAPSIIAPVIKELGGAPVNIPPGDIYTSVQKGVIDGFTMVSVGLMEMKAYEVAEYLARPLFAFISGSIFMNLNKYDELTVQEKEWINAAAIQSEIDSPVFFQKQYETEVIELKAHGMKETQFQAEDAQKMDKIFSGTIWAVSEKKSGQVIKDLHQLAKEKGML